VKLALKKLNLPGPTDRDCKTQYCVFGPNLSCVSDLALHTYTPS